jgi:hypothetical protein
MCCGFKITSTRNVSVEILIAKNSQIEKAHCHMVNKTLEAIGDVDSR